MARPLRLEFSGALYRSVETIEGNLAKGMRQLNGVYTQNVNRTHERVGHVFQGRYWALLAPESTSDEYD